MADDYPRSFGKYTLLRSLARGGMGEIFLAAAGELGGFEKLCVVKMVLAEQADQSKAARFIDEAKVVIRLSHGNLVGVFDAGVAEDEFYLAMEFVEGRDLGGVWNRCAEKRARFPVDIALYVVREVARGLAYAHTYGGLALVHRDVTPPNILISYFGEVKLTDFGLARSTLKQEFTQPGVVYGRLAYLSPEQAHGRPVDARSDIYSLGIILWELLTGTQLFRVSAADPVTAISVVRNPKVEPPSRRVPRLPPSLDELVMRALAPDSGARFQTAEELRRGVSVELAALAPTIDTERVAGFMRMLYGDEIERERAECDRLLGRDGVVDTDGRFSASGPLHSRGSGRIRAGRMVARGDAPASRSAKTVPLGRAGMLPPASEAGSPPTVRLATGSTEIEVPPAPPTAAPVPAAPPIGALGDEVSIPPPSRVGAIVDGRYRLDAVLGIGAMGTVYEAEHVEIGRCVALKILHPIYSRNAELVTRFRREARAATTIGHPNIVDVTDFGTTSDGCAYFVMERLRGQDLKQILVRERRIDAPRAVDIMIQVCRALQAAHDNGIVHRDLKPENVFLVTRDGTPDFVKILDFGIAKSLAFGTDDGRSLTLPGIAMGTPAYMAPEQASGQGVDARSDVYSVGAILYEMLAGVPPFDGEDVLDVMTRKTREEAPAPSTLGKDVPLVLEELVMRTLRRDAAERPESMNELADELRRALRSRTSSLLGLMVGGAPAPAAPRAAENRARGRDPDLAFAGTERVSADAVVKAHEAEIQEPVVTELVSTRHAEPRWQRSTPRWRRPLLGVLIVVGAAAAVAAGPFLLRDRGGRGPGGARRVDVGAASGPIVTPVPKADAAAPAAAHADAATVGVAPSVDAASPSVTDELLRLLEAARQAADAGRYLAPPGESMRDLLAHVEEIGPGNAAAKALRTRVQKGLHREADSHMRRRDTDKAEAVYRTLYSLDARDERAASGLGRALLVNAEQSLKRKKYGAAVTDAREAVGLDESSVRAHLILAEALFRAGKPAGAVDEYKKALGLKPKVRDAREARKSLARAERAARDAKAAREAKGQSEKKPPKRRGKH